ncbi:hypothetical protein ACOKFD_15865 [Flagellimonas sp. S174]|uniref:hypothetical protein n=1 Tax=Flagellimonas sp. S174 TaxID=3410790 RepID=UPI003BF6180F
MKKIFFMAIAVMGIVQFTHAQEQNKFRVGLDLGYAIPDGGGGVLIALEPKYNIADNMSIGIRFEGAAMAKNLSADGISAEAEIGTNSSYSATFDYYFNNGNSSFAPFLGAGAGYHSLANSEISDQEASIEFEVDGKFGGLVRAGFEVGKFRVAATYNLIGKTEFGEGLKSKNSYFGISLGFYVGGGKWKK